MARDDLIEATGTVDKILGGGRYQITLESSQVVTAQLSGRMRRFRIRVIPGDRVTVLATVAGSTRLTVEDAQVLEIDRQPDQIGSSGRGVLTIAVDAPETVMDIAHLTQIADITVVRSTRAIDDVFPAETDAGVEDDR